MLRAVAWVCLVLVAALMAFGMRAAIGQPAPADATMIRQCPSDRPHRLEIETGTMSCTSQSCMGRMDCGTGTCKVTRDLGDSCNTCSMRTYVACLSEQDLKAMRR